MIIGIDHGYYAIKTKQVCFPTGLMRYTYEPYTMQNVLQYGGAYYVCGTGRQTLVKDKTANDNYYLLTLAALAQEIRKRKGERTAKVILAAGLPLAGFGREKQKFKEYLFRKEQPVRFFYEGEHYEIQIEDVKLFPQGYSALALYPECLKDEPSVLLVDIGGYQIAAVLKADVSMFDFQQASFHSPQGAEAYVQQAKALSLFETGVDGIGCEKTLTLVTCSYEWKEARNILVAVKVGT